MSDGKRFAKAEAVGIVLLFVTVFLLLALITWSPEDPPNPSRYSGEKGINNLCGYFGALASSTLFSTLGVIASYGLLASLLLFSLLLITRQSKSLIIRIITAESLVFSSSIIEVHLLKGVFPYRVEGGIVGPFLSNVLTETIGVAGTVLSVTFVLFLSIFVLAGAPIKRLASLISGIVRRMRTVSEPLGEEVESFVRVRKRKEKSKPQRVREKRTTRKKESKVARMEEKGDYSLPPVTLLDKPTVRFAAKDERSVVQGAKALSTALAKLSIDAEVFDHEVGPTLISYRVRVDDRIRLGRIKAAAEDLGFRLGFMSPLNIVGPLDGEPDTVAVQVPRGDRQIVRLRELLDDTQRDDYRALMSIPLFLGKRASSEPFVVDLSSMPHLLIAGTTGSGKSICIHAILMSILMTRTPDEVRLVLIDPKMVELSHYADVPHLLVPVVEEVNDAASTLIWACDEMNRRYRLLRRLSVTDIEGFNKIPVSKRQEAVKNLLPEEAEEFADIGRDMPRIVIVVEELADISQTVGSPVEIQRALQILAQKARATGIHLILSTQRPSVDVVKGLIKANLPARIVFRVASSVDSRTIIDTSGAEKLLNKGDMYFRSATTTELTRMQGTFISDTERKRVVEFIKRQRQPEYRLELLEYAKRNRLTPPALQEGEGRRPQKQTLEGVGKRDELFEKAVEVAIYKRATISRLQRDLGIGYERAAKIMDQMEAEGIVGPEKGGARPRDILITAEEWEARKGAKTKAG